MMAVKEVSQRQLRVGQEIKKLIATMLERGEIHNLEVTKAFITVTEARITPDLKYCNVYIMTLNNENVEEVVKALNSSAWEVRRYLGANLHLRYTPEVNFRVDESFFEVDKIEKLLRHPQVAQDLQKKAETEE